MRICNLVYSKIYLDIQNAGSFKTESCKIRSASARGGNVQIVWKGGTGAAKTRGQARIASQAEVHLPACRPLEGGKRKRRNETKMIMK